MQSTVSIFSVCMGCLMLYPHSLCCHVSLKPSMNLYMESRLLFSDTVSQSIFFGETSHPISHSEFMVQTHETDISAEQGIKRYIATVFSVHCTPVGPWWPLMKSSCGGECYRPMPKWISQLACITVCAHPQLSHMPSVFVSGRVRECVILFLLS